MFSVGHAGPIPLVFYPDYRATNPYQTELYAALNPFVAAKSGTIADALRAQQSPKTATCLFHMHWEHQLLIEKTASVEDFLDDLAAFKEAGGKIVWTVHNLKPHQEFSDEDVADLINGLTELADVLHLHSLEALAAVKEVRSLPPSKVRIIPHGNYRASYPIHRRPAAREALGLGEDGMVVLLPGRIAHYKSPQSMLDTFREVAGPEDRLLIAGHISSEVKLEAGQDRRILIFPGFADPEDVATYHAAADLVVLPYSHSLTSGSAILAATLGRGVLGPSTPGLRDTVASGTTGVLYDPEAEDALSNALRQALSEGPKPWEARGKAATRAAGARDLEVIAAAWLETLTNLVEAALRRPPRGEH